MYDPSRKGKRRGEAKVRRERGRERRKRKREYSRKAYAAQFLQDIWKNKYSHHSSGASSKHRDVTCRTLAGMLGREDPIFYLGSLSDPRLVRASPVETPKYLCRLLLTYTVCMQLDTTPQEIMCSERNKYRITSRKNYPLACFHLVLSTEKSGKR